MSASGSRDQAEPPAAPPTATKDTDRIIFVDRTAPAEQESFRDVSFEFTESREMLDLQTSTRVYEEVVIYKTLIEREQVVGGILRRTEAEISLLPADPTKSAETDR